MGVCRPRNSLFQELRIRTLVGGRRTRNSECDCIDFRETCKELESPAQNKRISWPFARGSKEPPQNRSCSSETLDGAVFVYGCLCDFLRLPSHKTGHNTKRGVIQKATKVDKTQLCQRLLVGGFTIKMQELKSSIRGGLRGGGSIFLCIDLGKGFLLGAVHQAILKSTRDRDRPFGILLTNVRVFPECTFRWSDSLVCLPKSRFLFSGALSLFLAWTNGEVL